LALEDWRARALRSTTPRKHIRRLGIIHLRDISRFRQLMPTTMHRCRLVITICRPPVDPTAAQLVLRRGDPRTLAALPPEVRPETGPKKELPPQFRRALVDYYTKEPAGTIVIDTPNTYLYLVLGNGKALRYGIGVGREGFTWSGSERISRLAEWPDWNPPEQMIERQPYLPRFMAGGEGNPLGARALSGRHALWDRPAVLPPRKT
jgi:lipoprotein-anchoring transpeptidase ErfK/SrfK